jgi:hypothetical protein
MGNERQGLPVGGLEPLECPTAAHRLMPVSSCGPPRAEEIRCFLRRTLGRAQGRAQAPGLRLRGAGALAAAGRAVQGRKERAALEALVKRLRAGAAIDLADAR